MECIIVLVTCGDKKEAQRISLKLLEERLAACVNIIDHVESLFHWEQRVDRAEEVLLTIKTRHDLFDAVKHAVKDLHSYDIPEIVALPIVKGDEDYLNWVKTETNIK